MTQAKERSRNVVTTEWIGDQLTINVLGIEKPLTFDRTKASGYVVQSGNNDQANKHGWTQRLSNLAAIPNDPKTGKPANPQQKYNAIKRGIEHYEKGESVGWKMGAAPAVPLTPEQILAFLKGRTAEEQAAIVAGLQQLLAGQGQGEE